MEELSVSIAFLIVGAVLGACGALIYAGGRIHAEKCAAYQRGRDGAFQQMAQHRRRHLAVVRDEDATVLPMHAESRGGRA